MKIKNAGSSEVFWTTISQKKSWISGIKFRTKIEFDNAGGKGSAP